MIARPRDEAVLLHYLKTFPIVGLLGARQVGKTTLALQAGKRWKGPVTVFDLENPNDLARLQEPLLALGELRGLVILDEVQRKPELFPVLRVLADRPRRPARFLLLGSASPQLLRQSSESLAGRIIYHELDGLTLEETGVARLNTLWLRGGFPRSLLARTAADSYTWRRSFVQTFLERDLPELGITISSTTLRRFWTMIAHYHGQIWNASELARSFGVSDNTVRNYLDILSAALVVRQVPPWHENLSKRQVKAPKVYVRDSGILHSLLQLQTPLDVESHPKVGASWEGFMMEQVIHLLSARPEECYFWATYSGAELDLLIVRGKERRGFEFKRTSSPKVMPSMQIALKELKLKRLDVIHAGDHTFPMGKKLTAISAKDLLDKFG